MESKWRFPSEERELLDIVEKEGPLVHGGGTGISKDQVKNSKSVVSLSKMGWDSVESKGDYLKFGSMATFSKASRELERIRPGHVLAEALSKAASTALRNTITLGGSAAFFPLWSDLMGPFIGLGGKVDLIGPSEGIWGIEDYLSRPKDFKGSVIRSLLVPDETWKGWYYRQVRVSFDYPAFTVTLLSKKPKDGPGKFKAVVVGVKERYRVFEGPWDGLDSSVVSAKMKLDFPDKKSGSGGYLKDMASVWLERGILELQRGESHEGSI